MRLPLCEHTDLPRLLCGCPEHVNGVSGLTEDEHDYLDGNHNLAPIAESKRMRRVTIPEYTSRPWSEPRDVKVVDSKTLCQVPHCTKPAGDAYCCRHCLDDLEVALGDAPALLEDLMVLTMKQARFGGQGGKATDARPLPYWPPAGDMMAILSSTLMTAVRALAEPRRTILPVMGGEGASRWLLNHLEAVALDPAGPDIVADVKLETTRARKMIDRPDEKTYIGVCTTCSTAMHADPEKLEHFCTVCGTTYIVAARQQEMTDRVLESLLSLKELSELSAQHLGARVTLRQLEGWVRRGRLVKKGSKPHPYRINDEQALFRAGDVLALVEERKAS